MLYCALLTVFDIIIRHTEHYCLRFIYDVLCYVMLSNIVILSRS